MKTSGTHSALFFKLTKWFYHLAEFWAMDNTQVTHIRGHIASKEIDSFVCNLVGRCQGPICCGERCHRESSDYFWLRIEDN